MLQNWKIISFKSLSDQNRAFYVKIVRIARDMTAVVMWCFMGSPFHDQKFGKINCDINKDKDFQCFSFCNFHIHVCT